METSKVLLFILYYPAVLCKRHIDQGEGGYSLYVLLNEIQTMFPQLAKQPADLFTDQNLCFSGTNQKPERRRPFGTGLVRHCPQGLFSSFFTFLRAVYFPARLDFSSSPLSAPGSPRMRGVYLLSVFRRKLKLLTYLHTISYNHIRFLNTGSQLV